MKVARAELEGNNVNHCVADVTKSGDVQRYVNEAAKLFTKIDAFFNNAGIEGVVPKHLKLIEL